MKMPDLSACVAWALAAAFLCGLCGCSQSVDVPNSSLRRNAMEDYQAGRYDAAFAGFEHVLKSDPKDYLSHFQLAVPLPAGFTFGFGNLYFCLCLSLFHFVLGLEGVLHGFVLGIDGLR